MIYLEGTSKSQSLVLGSFRGLTRSLILTSLGKRQSLLAQKAAPPRKRSYIFAAALWFVAALAMIVLVMLLEVNVSAEALVVVLIVAVLAAGIHLRACRRFNTTEWPKLYETWKRSFLCRRCGTVSIF
ncbi:MAG TPA: hypothetical protein VFN53_02010 [Acidobacteriaceae bacterium]|nr:hypothetical protein [Acidobacteriaceae bacterium]